MQFTLKLDKVTKGAVRYGDDDNHNIYLRKEEAHSLGNPEELLITIDAMKKK